MESIDKQIVEEMRRKKIQEAVREVKNAAIEFEEKLNHIKNTYPYLIVEAYIMHDDALVVGKPRQMVVKLKITKEL